jgi:helicase-like protein
VLKIRQETLACRWIDGYRKGEHFELHRVYFEHGGIPSEPGIKWSRTQFPIRASLAMTFDKSQGQTLKRIALALHKSQCFMHGHLYTALSRVTDETSVRVWCKKTLMPDGTRKRIVRNPVVTWILDDG